MISKDTVEFLRRVGGAGEQARFTGRDAMRFVDLKRAGLVDAPDVVNDETWPDIIVMSPRVTDAGREELERSRHAVRHWLISHLDTILTAAVTSALVSLVARLIEKL